MAASSARRSGNSVQSARRAPSGNNSKKPRLTPSQLTHKRFSVCTVSKWLCQEEKSILCSVVESGDILEVQGEGEYHHWGIALRASEGGLEVACLRPVNASSRHDRKHEGRVVTETLDKFWPSDCKIRINNSSDRTKPYHDPDVICSQVNHALTHRTQKWHNCEHFAYWCRHGEVRQASLASAWGSLAATAGAWAFIRNRIRRNTQ